MNWISTNRRKPTDNEVVLVFAPNCQIIGPVLIGCYFDDTDTWTVYDFSDSKLSEIVTHWMPLPESPK